MDNQQTYTLYNGMIVPKLGFGTWQMPNDESTTNIIETAINAGYRHIDTAQVYKNEKSVGKGIKRTGISREEVFITTKLWNSHRTKGEVKAAIDESLKNLGIDYLDLYLIHWPNPLNYRNNWEEINAETWASMEEEVKSGKLRAIGISNFRPHHIHSLLENVSIKPVANQIYVNPLDKQTEITELNKQKEMLTIAYSPLGTGEIFKNEAIKKMTKKYNKSVAQIGLRWSLQHGFLPLAKTSTKERVFENINIFDFSIESTDMAILDNITDSNVKAPNPDEMGY